MNDKEVIRKIREGNKRVFERMFESHLQPFIAYMVGNRQVSKEDALDYYRMACAITYKKIYSRILTEDNLTSALRTYIFEVGKKLLYNDWKKAKRRPGEEKSKDEKPWDPSYEDKSLENAEIRAIIQRTVNHMPNPCDKLLRLRLFEERSSKEIARELQYKNEYVVNTSINRCWPRLVDTVKRRLKEGGYEI